MTDLSDKSVSQSALVVGEDLPITNPPVVSTSTSLEDKDADAVKPLRLTQQGYTLMSNRSDSYARVDLVREGTKLLFEQHITNSNPMRYEGFVIYQDPTTCENQPASIGNVNMNQSSTYTPSTSEKSEERVIEEKAYPKWAHDLVMHTNKCKKWERELSATMERHLAEMKVVQDRRSALVEEKISIELRRDEWLSNQALSVVEGVKKLLSSFEEPENHSSTMS